jgi:hypothetical protein
LIKNEKCNYRPTSSKNNKSGGPGILKRRSALFAKCCMGGAGAQEVDTLLESLPELMAQQDDDESTSERSSTSSSNEEDEE